MRHKLGYRKLNKTPEHRKALFKNMLNSLIKYEQIFTTLPKAKELKPKIDKIITIGKKSDLNNKKNLFSKLQDKSSVKKVFETFSKRYATRKGGYSRVLRAGFRTGDDAPMAVIELVDRDVNARKVDKPKKVETKKKEKETVEELVIPTELLEKDPIELADNENDIKTIISYLKKTRENIRAAEKAGKRITSKSARVKAPEPVGDNILDVLIDNV